MYANAIYKIEKKQGTCNTLIIYKSILMFNKAMLLMTLGILNAFLNLFLMHGVMH